MQDSYLTEPEKQMPKYSQGRLFTKALVASVVINVLMIATGPSGGTQGRSNLLTRLSDVLAAPPGLIINRCFAPSGHTGGAFLLGILEVTTISILFYSVVAWVVLELGYWLKKGLATGVPR
jgi:hypothetical protein